MSFAENGIHAMDSCTVWCPYGTLIRKTLQFTKRSAFAHGECQDATALMQPLLKCPVFDTPYQKLQLQVEELSGAMMEQKVVFLAKLTASKVESGIPEAVMCL
jgi:hypothetical protein